MMKPQSINNSSAKKKNCKLQISYKKLTMGLNQYKDIKQAHLKNRTCQQSTQYKQNKQCTFQPRLSTKKFNQVPQNRRSLKKFLQDQQKFSQSKRLKIQQLRQQISKQQQDQFTGKPSIDSVSHRISTQMSFKTNQKVFERLSKQKKLIHDVFQQQQMFSPKICIKSRSLKRQKDISSLLYEDAQRRRQKQMVDFQQLLKKQYGPQINNNTNQLVIRKFYSQFTSMVQQQNISPLLAITVISQIFNIDLNPNKSAQQQKLCEKVLFYIADTKTQTVNSEVLWNFIQTIVNGHLVNSNFSQQVQDEILQNFGHFYIHRLTKTKKNVTPDKFTFKPKTLQSSQTLAQNHRLRTLSSINQYLQNQKVNIEITNNSVKIEDLFIIEHMKKKSQHQKKRIEKQNSQLQQCSFRPNITLSTNTLNQSKQPALKKVNLIVPKTTKTQQLQKQLKIKIKQQQIQNKQNIENAERLKTMYESTNFIPSKRMNSSTIRIDQSSNRIYQSTNRIMESTNRINSSTNRSKQNIKPKAEVKNIQKSVMRVTLGRKNRQLVSALNQRGYPQNVQNWDSFRKSLKKGVQKSNQKILKGYNSLQKSNSTLLKSSTLITSKQINA